MISLLHGFCTSLFLFLSPSRIGLDLVEGVVRDNRACGVLEPAICKVKCLKFATEAAITILRIDDLIKLAAEEQSGPPGHPGMM